MVWGIREGPSISLQEESLSLRPDPGDTGHGQAHGVLCLAEVLKRDASQTRGCPVEFEFPVNDVSCFSVNS